MSRELVFHPDVADEVLDAYRWYEARQTGLGDDFLTAFECRLLSDSSNARAAPNY